MASTVPSDTPGAAEMDTKAQTIANTSGITPSTLSDTLREKLQAEHVVVEDISGMSSLFSLDSLLLIQRLFTLVSIECNENMKSHLLTFGMRLVLGRRLWTIV